MTLRNINIIACLNQNDKLMTMGNVFVVYEPTTFRGLLRLAWYRENREQNISQIQNTIRNAKSFIETVLSNRADQSSQITIQTTTQMQVCLRMLSALKHSLKGLINLEKTYKEDPSITTKIKMLRDEVTDFLDATASVSANISPLLPPRNEDEIPLQTLQ